MTVVETLLTFVVAPGALYGLIALTTVARRRSRRPRYRSGDAWPYEPLFWIATPEGAQLPEAQHALTAGGPAATTSGTQEVGGTGGKW